MYCLVVKLYRYNEIPTQELIIQIIELEFSCINYTEVIIFPILVV